MALSARSPYVAALSRFGAEFQYLAKKRAISALMAIFVFHVIDQMILMHREKKLEDGIILLGVET